MNRKNQVQAGLDDRLVQLKKDGLRYKVIAETLNAEGFTSGYGSPISEGWVGSRLNFLTEKGVIAKGSRFKKAGLRPKYEDREMITLTEPEPVKAHKGKVIFIVADAADVAEVFQEMMKVRA